MSHFVRLRRAGAGKRERGTCLHQSWEDFKGMASRGDGRTIREIGGELAAELGAVFSDEQIDWRTKEQVLDLVLGVLARHAGSTLANDEDLPVEPRPVSPPPHFR
jgi:hypothetical protein